MFLLGYILVDQSLVLQPGYGVLAEVGGDHELLLHAGGEGADQVVGHVEGVKPAQVPDGLQLVNLVIRNPQLLQSLCCSLASERSQLSRGLAGSIRSGTLGRWGRSGRSGKFGELGEGHEGENHISLPKHHF